MQNDLKSKGRLRDTEHDRQYLEGGSYPFQDGVRERHREPIQ